MNFDAVKNTLISEAERLGLKEYEVYFMESSRMEAETLKDEISSFSCGESGGVCFRCIIDGRMGNASSGLLTDEEMRALVSRAIENAEAVESADKAILYRGSEHYATVCRSEATVPKASELKRIALDIQKRTYAESELIADGTQSAVSANTMYMELMNSHGLHLTNRVSTSCAYAVAVIQKDGDSKEGVDWTLELDEDQLKRVSSESVKNALSKLGASGIPSGKYGLIISGKKMRDLLSAFSSAFSAKRAQLGMSLLKGKEGETVASEAITLIDDPMREGCSMQTAFDGEGVATYRKNVIERGKLKTLLYDLSTADRAGVLPTGNGQRLGYADVVGIRPYSFYLAPGTLDEKELLSSLGDGLYITEFKGMHAGCNPVTGDFSIESAGFRVRNGELCEAVEGFTVAGNFFELLKNAEALSNEVSFGLPSGFTSYGSPDVLLRDMSVAGQ